MEWSVDGWGKETPLPPQWCWTDCPDRLMRDTVAAESLRGAGRAALRRDEDGFRLALPWSCGEPFPIPPLFCLARPAVLSGRRYLVFCFSRQGRPCLYKFPKDGQDKVTPHKGGEPYAQPHHQGTGGTQRSAGF